jgi:hemolysin activation/secretion protein
MIRAFQVKGNHLIPPTEVEEAVYPFMGPDKTPDDVEHARAALQSVFEKKGFATVSVFIPEQPVDSGIIQLQVQPQAIGQVTVVGGHRTSADWVKRRATSLTPGTVPNFQDFQRDVVSLNQSADRKVTPEVKAGVAPGTVDVTMKVEDHLPLHGSLEFNNDASPETTPYRVLGTLRYDDMWGRGDSLSISAQTAPEQTKDTTVFSGNYLAHLGALQLLAYYVHSDSNVAVVGGTSVVGKGDMAGLRLIVPISQSPDFYQSLTAGIDYKKFGEDVRLGADHSSSPITYYPATVAWQGNWTTKASKSDASLSTTFGLRGLGQGLTAFDNKRFLARPDFFYVHFDASHTQDMDHGVQLYAHVSGQWAGAPLVSNEQFSLGGLTTVRGYFESEALGDYGGAIQTELRTPNFATWPDLVKGLNVGEVEEFRLHVFFDAGWAGIHNPLAGQERTDWLGSTGIGAGIKLFDHINGAVDVGAPIVSGPNTKTGPVFARFRIWGEY